MTDTPLSELLDERAVTIGASSVDRDAAIREVGELLAAIDAVDDDYVDAMLARERTVSTYVGEGIAVPHATISAGPQARRDALAFVSFAEPVDWAGEPVHAAIGIAAVGRGHIRLLSRIAGALLDPDRAARIRTASSADDVRDALAEAEVG